MTVWHENEKEAGRERAGIRDTEESSTSENKTQEEKRGGLGEANVQRFSILL